MYEPVDQFILLNRQCNTINLILVTLSMHYSTHNTIVLWYSKHSRPPPGGGERERERTKGYSPYANYSSPNKDVLNEVVTK